MTTAAEKVALSRWRVVVQPSQLITIKDAEDRFICMCLSTQVADQIVYVHNHWPGDVIVGPGGTAPWKPAS